jgi:hypothetical protein
VVLSGIYIYIVHIIYHSKLIHISVEVGSQVVVDSEDAVRKSSLFHCSGVGFCCMFVLMPAVIIMTSIMCPSNVKNGVISTPPDRRGCAHAMVLQRYPVMQSLFRNMNMMIPDRDKVCGHLQKVVCQIVVSIRSCYWCM